MIFKHLPLKIKYFPSIMRKFFNIISGFPIVMVKPNAMFIRLNSMSILRSDKNGKIPSKKFVRVCIAKISDLLFRSSFCRNHKELILLHHILVKIC